MGLNAATGVSAKPTGAATATQTIALGFSDGKAIWLWATLNTHAAPDTAIADAVMAWGISDGTTHYSVCAAIQDNLATSNSNRYQANTALVITDNTGAKIAECTAAFSGSDLVLSWTTNNAVAYDIHYLVLGGSDLTNAKVINSFTAKTSTGTQARSGFGFAPDFICVMTDCDATSGDHANTGVSNFMGFAANKASRANLTFGIENEDNTADSNAETVMQTNIGGTAVTMRAKFLKGGVGTENGRFRINSWDSDGYTEQWDVAAGGAWYMGVLALKGLQYDLQVDLCPTATGNDAQTGFGFTPAAMLHAMSNVVSGFSAASDVSMGLGACSSTSNEHAAWLGDNDNADPMQSDQRGTATYHLLRMDPGTPTLDVQAGLVSLDADGFTQNFATAPAVANYQGWIAFGAAAVGGDPRRRLMSQVVG